MIKQLFNRSLLLSAFVLGTLGSKAQSTITTSYTNSTNNWGINFVAGAPQWITFTVTNTNTYPVKIKEVHMIQDGGTTRNYTLWGSYTSLSGAPGSINVAGGWTALGTGSATAASTSVLPIVTGLEVLLAPQGCPGNSIRFGVVADSPFVRVASTYTNTTALNPASFTVGGVTVEGHGASVYMGYNSGATWGSYAQGFSVSTTGPPAYTGPFYFGFNGRVVFESTNIKPPPPIATAVPNSVCYGDSVTLSATFNGPSCGFTNPVYNWTWPGGTKTGQTVRVMVTATTTYSVTVTSNGQTSDPATASVIMNAPPAPLVDGKLNYCVNDPFVPLTVTGQNLKWYYTPAGGAPLPFTPTVNTSLGPQVETYYVSQTVGGCEGPRTKIVITVASKPMAPIVTSPIYYCEGDQAVPVTAIGQNLRWYYFASGGLPSMDPPTPPTSVQQEYNYYVSQNNQGCEGPRANIKVVVTYRPNGLIIASRDRLCQYDTIAFTYFGSAFPEAEFQWKIPEGASYVSGGGPGPLVIRFDTSMDVTKMRLVVGNDGCRSIEYTHDIKVDRVPVVVFPEYGPLCEGRMELISLVSYTPAIDTFVWDFDGGQTSHYATDQGPYGVTWATPGWKAIKLHIADETCPNDVVDSIEIRKLPDARIDADNYDVNRIFCAGDSIRMVAHNIEASSKYTWTPSRFFDVYSDLAATYARVDFTGFVKLHVKDQFGCENTDSILVKTQPCCALILPDAFSPNGDGKNDWFRIIGAKDTSGNMILKRNYGGHYDVRTFKVVNRYGTTVYESANELVGWDGTFKGKPQDLGTYHYYIAFMCNGKLTEQSGQVLLVR
jgi:gliding motility-associated-like protein